MKPNAGHRCRPRPADIVIEAWGPTRCACLEEAALAVLEMFADAHDAPAMESIPVHFGPDGDQDMLVLLLEEILNVVDVLGKLPVEIHLQDTEDGGVAGFIEAIPLERARTAGPLPRRVSPLDLGFEHQAGEWRCHAVIAL